MKQSVPQKGWWHKRGEQKKELDVEIILLITKGLIPLLFPSKQKEIRVKSLKAVSTVKSNAFVPRRVCSAVSWFSVLYINKHALVCAHRVFQSTQETNRHEGNSCFAVSLGTGLVCSGGDGVPSTCNSKLSWEGRSWDGQKSSRHLETARSWTQL